MATLTYRFVEEGGQVASICDELGLASYGKDIRAAKVALDEATSGVLRLMEERGELAAYLQARGVVD